MRCPRCNTHWIGVPGGTVVTYEAGGITHMYGAELRKCRVCSLVWLSFDPSSERCEASDDGEHSTACYEGGHMDPDR